MWFSPKGVVVKRCFNTGVLFHTLSVVNWGVFLNPVHVWISFKSVSWRVCSCFSVNVYKHFFDYKFITLLCKVYMKFSTVIFKIELPGVCFWRTEKTRHIINETSLPLQILKSFTFLYLNILRVDYLSEPNIT